MGGRVNFADQEMGRQVTDEQIAALGDEAGRSGELARSIFKAPRVLFKAPRVHRMNSVEATIERMLGRMREAYAFINDEIRGSKKPS